MRIAGVIPSRYGSSRFPGKPLALIAGKTLLRRVWEQCTRCRELDEIVIATDDRRIMSAARSFGARVVMTPRSCASGTDRLAAVARGLCKHADAFINIQGDEPLMPPRLVDQLARVLRRDPSVDCVTAVYQLKREEDINNPDIAKVVLGVNGDAIYFSRQPIPYRRRENGRPYYKHIGMYGYRRAFLREFASWKPAPLETAEQLEQLRILEHGRRIRAVISRWDSVGVDRPDDIRIIERLLA